MPRAVIVAELYLAAVATCGLLIALAVEDWPVIHQLPIAGFPHVGATILPTPIGFALTASLGAIAMIGTLVQDVLLLGGIEQNECIGTGPYLAQFPKVPILAVYFVVEAATDVSVINIPLTMFSQLPCVHGGLGNKEDIAIIDDRLVGEGWLWVAVGLHTNNIEILQPIVLHEYALGAGL